MASSIYWPTGLPEGEALLAPQRDGYAAQQRSPVLRSSFGIVDRSRRIYSDAAHEISLTFAFVTPEQWAYFTGFFWHELNAGTSWFWLPVRLAGVTDLREVNFHGAMPQEALLGANGATHACTVLTRKGGQISSGEYELAKDYGGYAVMNEALQALEDMVNE